MSPETYRAHISALGLTQEMAGVLFGASNRTGQTWAKIGPPDTVALLVLALNGNRRKLDRLRQRLNNIDS